MDKKQADIEQFFSAYEDRFNESLAGRATDIEGVVNSFAECFIEASPAGVTCGKNDEQFREVVPKGFEFYKSIGTKSMTIAGKEITFLDDLHAMVKIRWHSVYQKEDNKEVVIDFDIHYFLQLLQGDIKIFAYITGDEQKLLAEHGLI